MKKVPLSLLLLALALLLGGSVSSAQTAPNYFHTTTDIPSTVALNQSFTARYISEVDIPPNPEPLDVVLALDTSNSMNGVAGSVDFEAIGNHNINAILSAQSAILTITTGTDSASSDMRFYTQQGRSAATDVRDYMNAAKVLVEEIWLGPYPELHPLVASLPSFNPATVSFSYTSENQDAVLEIFEDIEDTADDNGYTNIENDAEDLIDDITGWGGPSLDYALGYLEYSLSRVIGVALSVPRTDVLAEIESVLDYTVTGIPVTKLQLAKQALNTFVSLLDSTRDRAALVTFNSLTGAGVRQPLTSNFASLSSKINGMWAGGNTPLGSGLQASVLALNGARSGAYKTIVLASDGIENLPPLVSEVLGTVPSNVTVHPVDTGAGVQEALLRSIATSGTGEGEYFRADFSGLADLYRSIFFQLRGQLLKDANVSVLVKPEFGVVSTVPSPSAQSTSGAGTTLTWNLGEVNDGESFTFDLNLRANTRLTPQPQGVTSAYPASRIAYIDSKDNGAKTEPIPALSIVVTASTPTECSDDIDNDGNGLRDETDPGCWTDPEDSSTYDPTDNLEFTFPADLSITADPLKVFAGGTSRITWNAANVIPGTCSITGSNGDIFSGESGNRQSSAINFSTSFTLRCKDLGNALVSDSVIVGLRSGIIFIEF
jgi:hypothetical protein